MAIQQINRGAQPDDNTGDPLRSAAKTINDNFTTPSHAASRYVGVQAGNVMEVGAFGAGKTDADVTLANPNLTTTPSGYYIANCTDFDVNPFGALDEKVHCDVRNANGFVRIEVSLLDAPLKRHRIHSQGTWGEWEDSGGLGNMPNDDKLYIIKNGKLLEFNPFTHAASDGKFYASKDGQWTEFKPFPDSPSDNKLYVVKNGGLELFTPFAHAQGTTDKFYASKNGQWAEFEPFPPSKGDGKLYVIRDGVLVEFTPFSHASADGKFYASRDGQWTEFAPFPPSLGDNKLYGILNGALQEIVPFTHAPSDNKLYASKNGGWVSFDLSPQGITESGWKTITLVGGSTGVRLDDPADIVTVYLNWVVQTEYTTLLDGNGKITSVDMPGANDGDVLAVQWFRDVNPASIYKRVEKYDSVSSISDITSQINTDVKGVVDAISAPGTDLDGKPVRYTSEWYLAPESADTSLVQIAEVLTYPMELAPPTGERWARTWVNSFGPWTKISDARGAGAAAFDPEKLTQVWGGLAVSAPFPVGATSGFYVFRVALSSGSNNFVFLSCWCNPDNPYGGSTYEPVSKVGVRIYNGQAWGYAGSTPSATQIATIYKVG